MTSAIKQQTPTGLGGDEMCLDVGGINDIGFEISQSQSMPPEGGVYYNFDGCCSSTTRCPNLHGNKPQ